jgi:hypothetical protein
MRNHAERFKLLADQWEHETLNVSSPSTRLAHWGYREILSIPNVEWLILERMKTQPGWWFDALSALTGVDPVPEPHWGDILSMTKDWLDWAEKQK